tara:strand:- start:290 stop:799 length:510 start_codon:yes stop_codon:yes gene_type:complete
MGMRIEPVTDFGVFDKPLRNIRASLDGEAVTLDLIPETTRLVSRASSSDMPDVEQRIVFGDKDVAREIVESDKSLRVNFDPVWGWVTYRETSDGGFPTIDMTDWPRLADTRFYYPFGRVIHSPWLAAVPDDQLPTVGNFVHFRILSATTCMDIISNEPEGGWRDNLKRS